MNIKHNKDGSVSIINMKRELYEAISAIVCCSEPNFILSGNEYIARGELKCGITLNEKEALDKEYWVI